MVTLFFHRLHFLRHNEPGAITIGWSRPRVFGDGNIKEYELQVLLHYLLAQ